jgi:hypothetical protein
MIKVYDYNLLNEIIHCLNFKHICIKFSHFLKQKSFLFFEKIYLSVPKKKKQ